jgi:hypothetical protein
MMRPAASNQLRLLPAPGRYRRISAASACWSPPNSAITVLLRFPLALLSVLGEALRSLLGC